VAWRGNHRGIIGWHRSQDQSCRHDRIAAAGWRSRMVAGMAVAEIDDYDNGCILAEPEGTH